MSFLDFIKPTRAEKIVRVKILSATMARPAGKLDTQHTAAGSVLDMTEADARDLVTDGTAERIGRVGNDGQLVPAADAPAKPAAPERAKPAPLPDSFKGLPVSFAKAWEYIAKRRAIVADLEAARERALPADFVALSGFKDGLKFYARAVIGEVAILEKIALGDAAKAAEDHLKAHDAREGYPLACHLLEASKETLSKIEAANAAIHELAEIAFDIFGIRIAALELAEPQRRKLFQGSGLFMRYASHSLIGLHGAVFLGGENPTRALDLPIEGMAAAYHNAAARLAEVEPLLVQARAELAAAQGVTTTTKAKRAA
ncbi:MAG: hypothetical protein H2172_03960 [Opitutus sp.]|nr:hypothetical protein [Opitutus sp.]MCS6246394.1 hypothetical protein [Opitutus sp.]MCS6273252.1 hypothetical protein [Opitutus sp.]MCS6277972.1 hypothetical protein [Opitutus sp.]MCS6298921.1 hypothetical protein [Opitutus sp.]